MSQNFRERFLNGLDFDEWAKEETGKTGAERTNAQYAGINQDLSARWFNLVGRSGTASGTKYANPNQTYGEVLQPMSLSEERQFIKGGFTPTESAVNIPGEKGFGINPNMQPEAQNAPAIASVPTGAMQTAGSPTQPPTTNYGDVLTLASGQKISPLDPNYATYARQLGVQQPTASTGTPIIPPGMLKNTVDEQAVSMANKLANKEYINGAFKAYHGRDANAAELAKFTKMKVKDAYNAIVAGSPMNKPTSSITNGITTTPPKVDEMNPEAPPPSSLVTPQNEYEAAKTEFNQFADSFLSGLDRQINSLLQKQEAFTTQQRLDKEQQRKDFESKFETVANTDLVKQYKDELAAQGFQAQREKLNSIQEDIVRVRESLNLGIIQEGERIAPMSIVTRRQQVLEQQGLARIGALTSIAQIYQGDMELAMNIADKTADLLKTQVNNQLGAYEKLINLAQDDIVSLKADEKSFLNAQIELLRESQKKIEDNKNDVLDLILKYPEAAQSGGVSFTDTKEQAVAKMQPALAKIAEEERQDSETLKNLGTSDSPSWVRVDKQGNVTPITINSGSMATPEAGQVGLQCGTWAIRQYSSIADGVGMGDLIEEKTAWVQKYGTMGVGGLQVGDLVISTSTGVAGAKYGHAFIVGGFDSNGDIIAYESNYKKTADGKPLVTNDRIVPIDSKAIVGYVRGTLKEGLQSKNPVIVPEADNDFRKDASSFIEKLDKGLVGWGTAFDAMRVKYPKKTNEEINAILGGSVDYNKETGEFSNPQGRGKIQAKNDSLSFEELG